MSAPTPPAGKAQQSLPIPRKTRAISHLNGVTGKSRVDSGQLPSFGLFWRRTLNHRLHVC